MSELDNLKAEIEALNTRLETCRGNYAYATANNLILREENAVLQKLAGLKTNRPGYMALAKEYYEAVEQRDELAAALREVVDTAGYHPISDAVLEQARRALENFEEQGVEQTHT